MKKFTIEIADNVKQKLIQQGHEELKDFGGQSNWISYINESFSLYQREELMRAAYANQRRLKTLQKIKSKTAIEIAEEKQLRAQSDSESAGHKLSKIYTDRLFFTQRNFFALNTSENKSRSIWSLWSRFAQFLNEKLISLGEEAVIDKNAIESIQAESEGYIFDHPTQLIADLSFLDEMIEELEMGIASMADLKSKEAGIYRGEIIRVLGEAKAEKTKVVTTLSAIKTWISEGNTQNIANQTKDKIEGVFAKAMSLPAEKWSEKELLILKEINETAEKIFPARIMTKPVYTLKDYVDICQVIDPKTSMVLKNGIPIEIESIPESKSEFFSFFHQGQDAFFDLFSNTVVKELSCAYQDLEALQALSVENPELLDVITQELPQYREKFMKKLDAHQKDVEEKIQKLTDNFLTRWIAEKEILALQNWLNTLRQFSIRAENIAQTLFLNSMSPIPKSREKMAETQQREMEKNYALGDETQRLIKESERLHAVYQQVVRVAQTQIPTAAASALTTTSNFGSNWQENKKETKMIPPPKPAKRIPQRIIPVSAKLEETGVTDTKPISYDNEKTQETHKGLTTEKPKISVALENKYEEEKTTPQQRREAVLKDCLASELINQALGEETQRLAENLQVLKEKRLRLQAEDEKDKATRESRKTSLTSDAPAISATPVTPAAPVSASADVTFTKAFSKTLANVCVARGEAMKKSQLASSCTEKQSENKDPAVSSTLNPGLSH